MTASQFHELPLFPLGTVLFQEGHLPLQIFEPRYLDLVARCMRDECALWRRADPQWARCAPLGG